jgi:DNA-binding Lrp family transcriptional regulator
MTNIYEVKETYTVVGKSAKDVEDRVVTSENQEFSGYTIQINPKEYKYWLVELEIRDGEFEYLDRYITIVDKPKNVKDAWDYIVTKELDYLTFGEDDNEFYEATDGSNRHFKVFMKRIKDEDEPILRRYL